MTDMHEVEFHGEDGTTTRTMLLPCALTDAELLGKAKELADRMNRAGLLDAQKKTHADAMKRQIDSLESEARILGAEIHQRAEERDVVVEEQRDDVRGEIRLVRTDTLEVLSTRPMTVVERQVELPLPRRRGRGAPAQDAVG